MKDNLTLVDDMKRIVNQRGSKASEIAKQEILCRFASRDDVSRALKHFAEVTFRDALPVFPALVSIACEAVGGKTSKTDSIGAAITLLAGAADLHDDVIDESPIKNGKRTVFGKYGKDVTILAGDALLAWGLRKLQKDCESIPGEQGSRILDFLTQAILGISHAEALETKMRTGKHLSMKACMNVIELKAIVPEVNMKIGAILGNGNEDMVESLGHYGRVFGIISTIAEEFMDVIERSELENRLRNDYPPLPLLCMPGKPGLGARIPLGKNKALTKREFEEIRDSALNCQGAHKIKKEMRVLVQNELEKIKSEIENKKAREDLHVLLAASLELLELVDD
jgi:geranylgeranyl pyrophosphate synthase